MRRWWGGDNPNLEAQIGEPFEPREGAGVPDLTTRMAATADARLQALRHNPQMDGIPIHVIQQGEEVPNPGDPVDRNAVLLTRAEQRAAQAEARAARAIEQARMAEESASARVVEELRETRTQILQALRGQAAAVQESQRYLAYARNVQQQIQAHQARAEAAERLLAQRVSEEEIRRDTQAHFEQTRVIIQLAQAHAQRAEALLAEQLAQRQAADAEIVRLRDELGRLRVELAVARETLRPLEVEVGRLGKELVQTRESQVRAETARIESARRWQSNLVWFARHAPTFVSGAMFGIAVAYMVGLASEASAQTIATGLTPAEPLTLPPQAPARPATRQESPRTDIPAKPQTQGQLGSLSSKIDPNYEGLRKLILSATPDEVQKMLAQLNITPEDLTSILIQPDKDPLILALGRQGTNNENPCGPFRGK